jgi:large subunit ribosomal protein L21
MAYAVIAVGGKQYVVHEGERLLVDRLAQDEGAVFQPAVLLVDAGTPNLKPDAGAVSARILKHTLGEKIRIAKYKPKKGYRRHTGFRAQLSQIQIEAIGTGKAARAKAETVVEAPAKETAAKPAPAKPEPEAKAPAKAPAKPAAAKPAAKPAAKVVAAKPTAKKPAAPKKAAAKAPAKAKVEAVKKPAAKRAAPRKKAES